LQAPAVPAKHSEKVKLALEIIFKSTRLENASADMLQIILC